MALKDQTRDYRIDQLEVDAAAIEKFAGRITELLSDLRFEARMTEDRSTGEAMEALANDLRDAANTQFAAMCTAHAAACDAENVETIYTPDTPTCAALGLQADMVLTRAQLDAAVVEIERRLGVRCERP